MAGRSAGQKALQVARVFHAAMLFAAIVYLVLPLVIRERPSEMPDAVIPAVVGAVALVTLGAAAFYRSRFVQPAAEALRRDADDNSAAGRWRSGVIVSLTFCESVVLFGLALRFLGVPWKYSGVYYGVGILFLLAWTPRLELPSD